MGLTRGHQVKKRLNDKFLRRLTHLCHFKTWIILDFLILQMIWCWYGDIWVQKFLIKIGYQHYESTTSAECSWANEDLLYSFSTDENAAAPKQMNLRRFL